MCYNFSNGTAFHNDVRNMIWTVFVYCHALIFHNEQLFSFGQFFVTSSYFLNKNSQMENEP